MLSFIKNLTKPSILFSIGLLCTIIVTYFICTYIGFDAETLFDNLDVDGIGLQELTAFEGALALFKNNIQVPIQILFLAIIPIPFLYSIVLFFNGIMIGFMFYIYESVQLSTGKGDPLFQMILKGFLPHALIELLAFVIATALAYRMNQWINSKIAQLFNSKKEIKYTFKELIIYTPFVFFVIIFPITIFAAAIESYITPLFL